jgi:hypothetical protein
MKSYHLFIAVIILAGLAFAAPAAPAAKTAVQSPQAAFAALKGLAGDWDVNVEKMGKTEFQYKVTSNGSAVMETLFPGSEHEMVTLYYMDGADLALTHYCAMGNQPRMKFTGVSDKGEYVFDFAGGSNIDPAKDMHMHAVRIRILGPDKVESVWDSWKDGKKVESKTFVLARKKPQ